MGRVFQGPQEVHMLPLQAFLPGLTSSPEHGPYSDSVTSLGGVWGELMLCSWRVAVSLHFLCPPWGPDISKENQTEGNSNAQASKSQHNCSCIWDSLVLGNLGGRGRH